MWIVVTIAVTIAVTGTARGHFPPQVDSLESASADLYYSSVDGHIL
jgi:hypothetical protein